MGDEGVCASIGNAGVPDIVNMLEHTPFSKQGSEQKYKFLIEATVLHIQMKQLARLCFRELKIGALGLKDTTSLRNSNDSHEPYITPDEARFLQLLYTWSIKLYQRMIKIDDQLSV